jgi:hypothetical protein
MHSSYNYCGFVDLYRSLSQQQPSTAGAGSATPARQSLAQSPDSGTAQRNGAAYRQRLRLVPR